LPVMDSGPLSRYCVMDGDVCRPIIVDIPEHVWWGGEGISMRARVVNATRVRERMAREQ